MRLLTKSRFKLGLECPTKLYYTHKELYTNHKLEDTFLEALAQGGFQVEELARMYYPNGEAILGEDWNYESLAQRTAELLQQENVVIFEAAFLYEELFIRVDILVKKGNQIKLIEVKAKSIDGNEHDSFIGKRGGLNSSWLPYLYDISFQYYVMKKCHPEWNITPYFKLVDKSTTSSIDGLNQFFKITKNSDLRTGIEVKTGISLEDVGRPVLTLINVHTEVTLIHTHNPSYSTFSFSDLVDYFQSHYSQDIKINTPIGVYCKKCEFYDENQPDKSGLHECWKHQLKLNNEQIEQAKVYDVWNFRGAASLMTKGIYFIKEVTAENLNIKYEVGKLSNSERQWLQIQKEQEQDSTAYLDIENLKITMNQWKFPLNFIDFETSAVALPFTKERHPYESIAFQFSHHIVEETGAVIHHFEYLNASPGVFPNFDFVRALKKSLSSNGGTIFRYHNHENTILNKIYEQLVDSNEPDKEELLNFIKEISHSSENSTIMWKGTRDMVDLFDIVKSYYYHPLTKGSISIKAVLPTVLNSDNPVKEKYTKPLKEIGVSSHNFEDSYCFVQEDKEGVMNPYKLLSPLFNNWSDEQMDQLVSELETIADGGGALTAYSKLQFENMSEAERNEISKGLLKYCELDTLAMVIIYEYFKNEVDANQ